VLNSWSIRLIVANVVMYILTSLRPELMTSLMFVPAYTLDRPWTVVTYMFLHSGTFHILFNMMGLLFFGPRLELEMGSRDFLLLYFMSGIAGALLSCITPFVAIVGASGAVFGIFLAYARFWPRDQLLIWGIIPVEARTMVIIMTVMSLVGGFTGVGNIAHFAHLGGFVGGYLFLKFRDLRGGSARRFIVQEPPPSVNRATIERWRNIDRTTLHEVNRAEFDRIMQKLNSEGIQNLTAAERAFLERFSSL
jgi:membrane associated rhomboid family serine protease